MTRWQQHSVSESNKCGECGDQFIPTARYTVMEKQRLCDGCAKKGENTDPKPSLPEPIQAVWRCPAHEKELVKVVDTTCGYKGMCHTCALTDHAGHSFEDVEKFEMNIRGEVRKRIAKVLERKEEYKNHTMQFDEEKRSTLSSLERARREISAAVDEDILGIRDKQREMCDIIKQRAEEEIQRETQIIKSQMERDIRRNVEEAEEKIESIKSRGVELNKKCEQEDAVWTEAANNLQKDVETVTDELGSLITLTDADVQSLVAKTNDIKLLDGKALPIVRVPKSVKFGICWRFSRWSCKHDSLGVGDIRTGKKRRDVYKIGFPPSFLE